MMYGMRKAAHDARLPNEQLHSFGRGDVDRQHDFHGHLSRVDFWIAR